MGLLHDIASLGNEERQCLLEREAVARLVQFYQTGRGDRLNVGWLWVGRLRAARVCGEGASSHTIMRVHVHQSTIPLEQSFTRAAETIDLLVRSCRTGSEMRHPPNNVGGCALALSERSRNKVIDDAFMVRGWLLVPVRCCNHVHLPCLRVMPQLTMHVGVSTGRAGGQRPRHRCAYVLPPLLRRHRHRGEHAPHAA